MKLMLPFWYHFSNDWFAQLIQIMKRTPSIERSHRKYPVNLNSNSLSIESRDFSSTLAIPTAARSLLK